MKKTVLVTGGTGYIGSWIVKGLLEKGYTVKLSVRDIQQSDNYAFLLALAEENPGNLEIFQANLLDPGSFDKAASQADAIIHVASPFKLKVKNNYQELIAPALEGTENILSAAMASKKVKKVVLTSSVGAIYGDLSELDDKIGSAFSEDDFNQTSTMRYQPYEYSKTVAEKKAWAMNQLQKRWDLVVINPSFVMGPPLNPNSQSESLAVMQRYLDGKYSSGVPQLSFGFVDVRDVAKAHIYALENRVFGRHILAERVTDLLSFAKIIGRFSSSNGKIPTKVIPKSLLYFLGPFIGMSRKFIYHNVGRKLQLKTEKGKKQLQLQYIPLERTVLDMIGVMEPQKTVK